MAADTGNRREATKPHKNGPAGANAGTRPIMGRMASSLDQRNSTLRLLDSVGQALGSSLEIDASLTGAIRALLDAQRYSGVAVLLLDWDSQEIVTYSGLRSSGRSHIDLERHDLLALPQYPKGTAPVVPLKSLSSRAGIGSLLTSPIVAAGQVLGVLAVTGKPTAGRKPYERRLLRSIAQRIGTAVSNARLYAQAREEADRLAAVSAVGDAVRRSLHVPRILSDALRQLLLVTDLEFGVIYLISEAEGTLSVAARASLSPQTARWIRKHIRQRLGHQLTILDGQPTIEEDLPTGDNAPQGTEAPRCLMHVPLTFRSRPLGLLTVGSHTQSHFAPRAVELLAAMGSQISLALENVRLYEKYRTSARELEVTNTQLAETNEALRDAIRSKDHFLANVTHELKRPLAPARLVVEALLESPERFSAQRQEKMLRNVLDNLDSMDTLVTELLDAVRLQRQPFPSLTETIDLRTVTRRSLAAMRPLAEARGVKLHAIIPSAPIRVRGDPEGLARVVANLLSNAVKFNREAGSVLVQIESTAEGTAVLSVTDTGVGIPPHARPRVFEHFYQADSSSTRAHEGLGLGLYIAKGIVEQHGGRIRFDSQEGVGTTFTVTLPLARKSPAH